LKLKCDEPLSNFAFHFSLRPYGPGTQRKIRDRLLICELLMRLAW
jgi:hypothetical protein